MANVVKIKRSTTSGNVPPSLVSGEIAVNEADGRLFYRNPSGTVTLLPLLVEAQNTANFPATGAANTLYVSTDTGRCYHWVNNSVYVEIGPPAGPSQASGAYIYSLPPATSSDLGGIIAGDGTSIAANGTLSVPPATSISLGGVKIGANVSVAIDGTISVAAPSSYSLPVATASVLGGVKQGSNTTIAADGTISVAAPVTTLAAAAITGLATVATSGSYADLTNKPSAYSLPVATASVLGGVKQGSNTTISADGTISVAAPVTTLAAAAITGLATVATSGSASDLSVGTLPVARLPLATVSVAGAMIVGSGLSVTSGTVSADVTSVNTKTGAVTLAATDVGAIASNTTGITGSAAVGNIVSLTAAQYAALGSKTASTLYIVTG